MLSALNRAWLSRPPYRADKAAEDGPTSNRERIAPPDKLAIDHNACSDGTGQ
jgi:hypothetical protein